MGEIDPMEYGQLREMASRTASDLQEMKVSMQKLAEAVQGVQLTLASASGGWKMFVGIGGAFFTAGGLAWEVLRHFFK